MYRYNKKLKVGVRLKIVIALILTFIIGELGLFFIVRFEIESNTETQITKDVKEIKTNTDVYVKQILILNSANNDEESFKECATDILVELYNAGKRHLALYTTDGVMISSSNNELFQREDNCDEDLEKAKEKKIAYSMQFSKESNLDVYFSMPAYVEDRYVGIVRYYMDYSDMREEGNRMCYVVTRVAAIIFIGIFITVMFVLNRMVKPIHRLAGISSKVTDDIQNSQFDGKHYLELGWSKRKDEIGELTNNFKVMLKTMEGQLERLSEDKEEIYRLLQSRKVFYDNVTHELKTPLTTITGYAQLLESNGMQDTVLFEKGVKNIQEESQRLHKMVIQLLEMADYEQKQEMLPTQLESIIKTVADSMQLKAKRYENHIITQTEKDLVIYGQADRIRQLLINLIDNAVKYGSPREDIIVAGKKLDDSVWISITNKGKGLTKEEMNHIFEPFYRVDKAYSREQGSAGLGLSICDQIMKEHGGEIMVESVIDEQTTFTLRFPIAQYDQKEGEKNE